jgi:hypothetical protein
MSPKEKLPSKGDIILLYHNNHYNTVRTYQQAVKNILKDDNI